MELPLDSWFVQVVVVGAVGVQVVGFLDRTGLAFLPNVVDFEGPNKFGCEPEARMFAKVTTRAAGTQSRSTRLDLPTSSALAIFQCLNKNQKSQFAHQ